MVVINLERGFVGLCSFRQDDDITSLESLRFNRTLREALECVRKRQVVIVEGGKEVNLTLTTPASSRGSDERRVGSSNISSRIVFGETFQFILSELDGNFEINFDLVMSEIGDISDIPIETYL